MDRKDPNWESYFKSEDENYNEILFIICEHFYISKFHWYFKFECHVHVHNLGQKQADFSVEERNNEVQLRKSLFLFPYVLTIFSSPISNSSRNTENDK